MIDSLWPLLRMAGAILFAVVPDVAAVGSDPADLVLQLANVGSRSPGTEGHRTAQLLLLQAMNAAGLQDVRRTPPVGSSSALHLSGTLPGRSATEIVLTAHYDTVEASPGYLDNASGCAATLGTVGELSRAPRRNTLHVVLTDGEENQAAGSREWLSELAPEGRRRMLANLNVDMVGSRLHVGPGIVHIIAGWDGDQRVVSPAWLVHAALRGAETSGLAVAVLDPHWSWLAQLTVRCALPARVSDGRRFLESGIPSVTLSDLPLVAPRGHRPGFGNDVDTVDVQRLRSWMQAIAATSRRLDGLDDRPSEETEYLVLGGRVWIRRDLVWAGFILWIALVWRGLPGSWRHRDSQDRRRIGRSYLPGFAFRILFLVAVFLIPSFATLLLYPLAPLALVGTARPPGMRYLLCLLGALPALVFAAWLTVGQLAGWFILERVVLLPATLVLLTLATFCGWQLDPTLDRVSSPPGSM